MNTDTTPPLLMLVVARSATAAQARLLLQPLQRAGVQPVLWLADQDPLPAAADAAQALVLLNDPVLHPTAAGQLVQLLRSFWHRRLTVACFEGSAHWLHKAGLVSAEASLDAEGVMAHAAPADAGALAELADMAREAPHALR